jgi:FdhD protein
VDGSSSFDFRRIAADGASDRLARAVACEGPVAIEFNGIGYAVLMATPADLIDLAYGFALAERLIDGAADIVDAGQHETAQGIILRLQLGEACAPRIADRVRHRTTESACGLCGIENLEQALRPLPRVTARSGAPDTALFRALTGLPYHQPLNRATGAAHVAAACAADGAIRLAREDVGRHNAFDKLIGAMLRDGMGWDHGFALLTSRCSYELVEKAALSACPMLATISAPTALAIARAHEAGLELRVLARPDSLLRPVA